jgi:hypothetical protein
MCDKNTLNLITEKVCVTAKEALGDIKAREIKNG